MHNFQYAEIFTVDGRRTDHLLPNRTTHLLKYWPYLKFCQSWCFHNHHQHHCNSTVAAAQGHHSWRSLLAPVQHRKAYGKSNPNVKGDVHTPEQAACPMSRVHSMILLAWEALASANNVIYKHLPTSELGRDCWLVSYGGKLLRYP